MNDEQESESYRLVAWILGIAVTIAIAAAIIPGILGALGAGGPAPAASAPVAQPPSATAVPAATTAAPAAAAPQPTSSATTATAAGSTAVAAAVAGPVKLYFESGKTSLPVDAATQLKAVVDAVKAGNAARLVVSGFHDKSGDPAMNAELAKNRAFGVRDALKAAGVNEAQIDMQKPTETEGSGSAAEARRVEVIAVK